MNPTSQPLCFIREYIKMNSCLIRQLSGMLDSDYLIVYYFMTANIDSCVRYSVSFIAVLVSHLP